MVSIIKVIFALIFSISKCCTFSITAALLLSVMAGTTRLLKPTLRELIVQQWSEQQQIVVCLTTISSPITRISYSTEFDSIEQYKVLFCLASVSPERCVSNCVLKKWQLNIDMTFCSRSYNA